MEDMFVPGMDGSPLYLFVFGLFCLYGWLHASWSSNNVVLATKQQHGEPNKWDLRITVKKQKFEKKLHWGLIRYPDFDDYVKFCITFWWRIFAHIWRRSNNVRAITYNWLISAKFRSQFYSSLPLLSTESNHLGSKQLHNWLSWQPLNNITKSDVGETKGWWQTI